MDPHVFSNEELLCQENLTHWTVVSSMHLINFHWEIPNFDPSKNNRLRSPDFRLIDSTAWLELYGPYDVSENRKKVLQLKIKNQDSVKKNVVHVAYISNSSIQLAYVSFMKFERPWQDIYLNKNDSLQISYMCLKENCQLGTGIIALHNSEQPELVWSNASYDEKIVQALSITYKWIVSLNEIKSPAGAVSSILPPIFFAELCGSGTWKLKAFLKEPTILSIMLTKPADLRKFQCFWTPDYNDINDLKKEIILDDYLNLDLSGIMDIFDFPCSKNPNDKFLIMVHIAVIPNIGASENTDKTLKYTGKSMHHDLRSEPSIEKFLDFGKLLFNKDYSDFSIITGESMIPTHKVVLSLISPVFQELFKNHSKITQLVINDLTQDSVLAMLKFAYTQEIDEDSLAINDFFDLFALSFKYKIIKLQARVRDILKAQLNVKNVVNTFTATDSYGDQILKENIVQFIKDNINEISEIDYKRLFSFSPELGAKLVISKK